MNIPGKTKLVLLLFLSTLVFSAEVVRCGAATNNIVVSTPATNASPEKTTYQFASCIDGNDDYYSLRCSNSPNSGILLIYFHSFAGDFNELYKSKLADAINKAFPFFSLLSCNYGHTPSWGNTTARLDITNNIRQVMKKTVVKHIVLVGTSMGASTALSYAGTAPSYIKHRIRGIVAVAPCAELEDLYQKSMAPELKPSLEAALGANAADKPALYHQNSFDACVAFLPQPIKVAIIIAKDDTLVPLALQMDVVHDLNNRDINTKTFEMEGKSEPLPVDSIMEGLHFVLQ